MAGQEPTPGPGRFRWNAGGWFGSQVGGTAWMLTGALEFARRAPSVSVGLMLLFAATNALGLGLWCRRDRVSPFAAIMILLLACGAGLLATLLAIPYAGVPLAPNELRIGYRSLL